MAIEVHRGFATTFGIVIVSIWALTCWICVACSFTVTAMVAMVPFNSSISCAPFVEKERLITEQGGFKLRLVIMRSPLAVMWGLAVLGTLPGRADDVLPPRFNFDRYSRMVDHSPFAIATAVALPAATPNFAKDLYVANAARSPEGDMVTIMSSVDHNFKKYLNTKEPVDGYGIASIEWSEKVGATKVTISKDGKFATLTFNQALLSQAASTRPPPPGQMPRSMPLVPPSVSARAPHAHTRGVIQRNPKAVAAAASTPIQVPVPMPELAPPAPPAMPLPNLNIAPSVPDASQQTLATDQPPKAN